MNKEVLTQKNQEKIFNKIKQKPEFTTCADCPTKGPCWASLDFGILICMNCSGAHRHLGPTISRVKSTKLDTWTMDMVELIDYVGNQAANEYWEYVQVNPNKALTTNSSLEQRIRFITDKYVRKLYIGKNIVNPMVTFLSNRASGNLVRATTSSTAPAPVIQNNSEPKQNTSIQEDLSGGWNDWENLPKQNTQNNDFIDFQFDSKQQNAPTSMPTKTAPVQVQPEIDLLGGFQTSAPTQTTSQINSNNEWNPWEGTPAPTTQVVSQTTAPKTDPFGFTFNSAPTNTALTQVNTFTSPPSFPQPNFNQINNSPGGFTGFQSAPVTTAPFNNNNTTTTSNATHTNTSLNIMNLYGHVEHPVAPMTVNSNVSHTSNTHQVNEDRYRFLNQMNTAPPQVPVNNTGGYYQGNYNQMGGYQNTNNHVGAPHNYGNVQNYGAFNQINQGYNPYMQPTHY